MKKILLAELAAGLMMLTIVSAAQAISITDVGTVDALIAPGKLANSGKNTETNWVNSILDPDVTFESQIDTNEGAGWQEVTGTGVAAGTWAHILDAGLNPAYFLIKTGQINKEDKYRDFLFRNNSSLGYAVINLSELGIIDTSNARNISHITQFAGAPVPEPATMLLLGTGLIGLAGLGRKKKI